MGTTPRLAIPYVEPADRLADFPTTHQAQSQKIEDYLLLSAPALPDPADAYVSADQVITNPTRVTETPTQCRVTMVNPHPTRRMLCRVINNPWCAVTGANTTGYSDVLIVSGGAGAIPATASMCANPSGGVTASYMTLMSEVHVWVAAAGTLVAGMGMARGGTGTVTIRYAHTQVIPIRYEGQ